jgi:hypothetical protein
MRIATRISFAVTVPVLILAGRAWTNSGADAIPLAPLATVRSEARRFGPVSHRPIVAQETPLDDGTVDLYGNDVSDAVARYQVDPEGSLYELHSPHTELPRLGSPKS